MRERRCFVQFIHPGGEHRPDVDDFKHWNRDEHRRKFMLSQACYLDDDRVLEGRVEFWGEWEPESHVVKRFENRAEDGPRFLYEPHFVRHRDTEWRQNTDPFVFGNEFMYTGCLQHTRRGPTQLRRLLPGSLLLFGSCRGKRRFAVDTIFVVGSRYVDHDARDHHEVLRPAVSDTYWTVTGEPWYRGNVPLLQSHRLYFGATYDRPVGRMFSFFPCLPHRDDSNGFARPTVEMPGRITPHLTQGKKITRDLDLAEAEELWETVVGQVRDQGLLLGVRAELPPEHTSMSTDPSDPGLDPSDPGSGHGRC